MIKSISRLSLAAAAAALALSPVAAQANTRASQGDVCYVCSAAQVPIVTDDDDDERGGRFRRGGWRSGRVILGVAAFSAAIAAIIAASRQGRQSPGT
jgi:hypothetical protein